VRDVHVTGVQTCALPISPPTKLLRGVRDPVLPAEAGVTRNDALSNGIPHHVPAEIVRLAIHLAARVGDPLPEGLLLLLALPPSQIGRAACRASGSRSAAA